MQKISKINKGILFFSFLIEFVLLVFIMDLASISIYSNVYKLIKVLTICFFIDEMYALYLLDFSKNRKKNKNILKMYKTDVNWVVIKGFFFVELIKYILIIMSEKSIQNTFDILRLILLGVFTCFVFYGLYLILPKRENLMLKTSRLKIGVDSGKTNLRFILIDGDKIPSSFNFRKMAGNKISRKNMYINLNTDFQCLINENKKMKKFILDNTVALIHEVQDGDLDNILRIYKENEINNCHMYHIMAVNNYEETEMPDKVGYVNAIKICDVSYAIDYVENLLSVNIDKKVSRLKYIATLKKLKFGEKKSDIYVDRNNARYTKKLDTIYKYSFNNNLKYNPEEIPKEEFSFELYRNAILSQSPYEAVEKMLNYITFIGKLIGYYTFAKHNPRFTSTDVYSKITEDDASTWGNQILFNVNEHREDMLYDNIRANEFEINKSEKYLLKYYLSKLLHVEIIGDTVTFEGILDLYIKFKNKVDTQRFINKSNIYCVWRATMFFAEMLNKMLNVSQLQSMFDVYNKEVMVGYGEEEMVKLGKYVTINEGVMCLISKDNRYMDFFNNVVVKQ